jgi:hypothetical protein
MVGTRRLELLTSTGVKSLVIGNSTTYRLSRTAKVVKSPSLSAPKAEPRRNGESRASLRNRALSDARNAMS